MLHFPLQKQEHRSLYLWIDRLCTGLATKTVVKNKQKSLLQGVSHKLVLDFKPDNLVTKNMIAIS
jgi:hypothetical protein